MPFLSPIVLRASRSVNIATFHAFGGWSPAYQFGSRAMRGYADRLHGRIAVSAAARHFIDRFFPGDYKVIPNGVDVARFRDAVPIARWQDGTSNILFVGRHEPRKGLLDLLKAHRILRKTGCNCRLLVVGTGPQEREARRYVLTRRMSGRRVPGPRLATRRRPSSSGRPTSTCRRPPAASRSASSCSRRWRPGAPIVASDIHGYKGVVKRGEQGLLVPPRKPKAIAAAVAQLLDDPELRAQMSASGRARAEEFSWTRVTAKVEAYYGFVIRRLAAAGTLPADFRAAIPAAPPRPVSLVVPPGPPDAALTASISAIAGSQAPDILEI